MAVLGLCCCAGFLQLREQGLPSGCRAQALGHVGSAQAQ